MAIFSPAQIARFAQQAEADFATEFPCIVSRESIDITSSISEYTLEDYIFNIRKIYWLGRELSPITHRNFRETAVNAWTSEGLPREFVFNNIGQSKLKFFPAPSETISALTSGLWGESILDGVIIEYYRLPDFSTYTLPTFIRRRMLKAYVNKMSFSVESKAQDLKAAKYWDARWKELKRRYSDVLDEIQNQPRKIINGIESSQYNRNTRTPRLPDTFGISVEDYE